MTPEVVSRIADTVAEVMIEFPDLPLADCIAIAWWEELVIYGDPDAPTPKGFLSA